MVISPEHPLIDKYKDEISNIDLIEAYRDESSKKSDFERSEVVKEKTGYRIEGLDALNPISEKVIPIYVSDYVLMTYGTGAIMAVPGHDERDYEFATKFNLPIVEVVSGGDLKKEAYTQHGTAVNSPLIDGLATPEAKEKMTTVLEEKGIGNRKVNFKLRDWVFSRQRYWGEPIPLVYCEHCGGWVPIDESELPLLLPEVAQYQQTDTGESPLANMPEWYNTKCPKCGQDAIRETDTMPQWAGSSWYYLRYTDPHNDEAFASKDELEYWMNVDWYNGGMEHTTLHLLYSRFWHKFLYDIGVVNTKEPYAKRTSHGMILGDDNQKMSKSRGNVVNPDDVIRDFGADTLRTYEMFIGDFEKAAPWNDDSVRGCKRFLDRVYNMSELINSSETGYSADLETKFHQLIKKVTLDYDNLKFNTAISSLMKMTNDIYNKGSLTKDEYKTFLILLNPVAPHLTEELWELIGEENLLCEGTWPIYDEAKVVEDEIEIPIQINGKLRSKITVPRESTEEEIRAAVHEDDIVTSYITGKTIKKEIFVQGRIYNLVIG
jgi:leucyl-tRNA synthetase